MWRFAVALTFGALAAWLLFWVVPPARGADEFKVLGVVLAAIVPILVWNKFFPPRFILSADNTEGDFHFHFCDDRYAAAFDALNHLPPRQPLPLDTDQENGWPAGLDTTASPDRLADTPSTGNDRSNPYQNLKDPRFKN